MDALITVRNVNKTYQAGDFEVRALQGVDADINSGDFVAIMGASGSGKSTFMNIIGCLDIAENGSYHLDGEDVFSLDSDQLAELRNRKLGFVFQSFNILPRTSALENVELPLLYNDKIGHSERLAKSMQALRLVGLDDRAGALLPEKAAHRPAISNLEWHQENCFVAR